MPEDESENKQIEGRTCRQDDPGSARKILFAADLEKEFGIEKIENARANSGKDWDTFLLELRDKHQVNNLLKPGLPQCDTPRSECSVSVTLPSREFSHLV